MNLLFDDEDLEIIRSLPFVVLMYEYERHWALSQFTELGQCEIFMVNDMSLVMVLHFSGYLVTLKS